MRQKKPRVYTRGYSHITPTGVIFIGRTIPARKHVIEYRSSSKPLWINGPSRLMDRSLEGFQMNGRGCTSQKTDLSPLHTTHFQLEMTLVQLHTPLFFHRNSFGSVSPKSFLAGNIFGATELKVLLFEKRIWCNCSKYTSGSATPLLHLRKINF